MGKFKLLREPRSLQECLRLLTRVQFVICCSGFYARADSFVLNKWTRLYTLACAGLVVLGLACSTHAVLELPQLRERLLRLDKLVLSIMGLECVLASLVFILTVLSLQARAHRHLGVYQRLAEIDERLVSSFGARLNYGKLLRKHALILTLVIFLYLGAVGTGLAQLARGHHLGIVVPAALCYIIITGGPHLTGYVYMSMAEILGIRFRLLQRILQPQLLKGERQEQKLRSLVEMVKELHFLILEINRVYSTSVWSALAHDFALSTSELYIIFGRSAASGSDMTVTRPGASDGNQDSDVQLGLKQVVFLSICMIVPVYKMMIGPVYCSRSVDEGRRCLERLEQLDNWFPGNAAVKQLVQSTMRWRIQFRIKFTSGTSTVLDKTVITLYISIVSNYLLVLISFAMIQQLGEQVEEQRVALKDWIGI